MRVGLVGGTGPAGRALATRLASVGLDIVIGSRSVERARTTCDQIHAKWPDRQLSLEPGENVDAARADLVVVATPWDAAASTAASVAGELDGKVVVSIANALERGPDGFQPVIPRLGSVAAEVQETLPGARVAAAFQHLPARTLADIDSPINGDVLICSDYDDAVESVAELVRAIPGLRPLHAGRLASAAPVEAFTAVLLGVNHRYKARAVVKLNGIPD
ncbi:MAG TPA: NADPH-dependent F420 reductase [Acidimicrobiales bacterium]|nr:NADPH-dependent F420 reductase [Acidimicrobiales bacterium]